MIRRYIIWRNRHADDRRLHTAIDRANVACHGTGKAAGHVRLPVSGRRRAIGVQATRE
ncbi:hypothetical protein GCM10010219_40880 [Streptomyces netropsis]|nr:hypothetical protein GCM10010219_40880 [Streptomyces netropsis]